MKTFKRLISVFLVLSTMLTCVPVFAAQEPERGVLEMASTATKSSHRLSLIRADGEILVRAEDIAAAFDGELRQSENGNWELDGAGSRKLVFSAETGRWMVRDVDLDSIPSWWLADVVGGSMPSFAYLDDMESPAWIDGEMYVPLIEMANQLGGAIFTGEDKLLLQVADMSWTELFLLSYKLMRPYAPLAVTTWEDKDQGLLEDAIEGFALGSDIILDIIANGKIWSTFHTSYKDQYMKDVLISSAGGSPSYSMSALTQRWDDLDFTLGILGRDIVWDDKYKGLQEFWFESDKLMKSSYSALTNNVVDGVMDITNDVVDYFVMQGRLAGVSAENILLAKTVFIDGREYIADDFLYLTAEEVFDEYINGFDTADFSKKKFAEYATQGLVSLQTLSESKSVSAALLALDLELEILQRLSDYDYGTMYALDTHARLQELIRSAWNRCRSSDAGLEEKLFYAYACAMMYAQVKASSLALQNTQVSIMGEGVVGQEYARIAGLDPRSIALSIPENASKTGVSDMKELLPFIEFAEDAEETPPQKPAATGFSAVNFGILLKELENQGVVESASLNDCDGDGELEMLAVMMDPMSGELQPVHYVAEASGTLYACGATGAAQDLDYVFEKKSGRALLLDGYYTAGYTSKKYMRWNGSEWEHYADGYYSQGVFEEAFLGEKSLSEEEWLKFEAGIDRKAFNEVEYDIIYTVNVMGEAEEILADYTAFAEISPYFVCSASGEIAEAGGDTTVYLYRDYHTLWADGLIIGNLAGSVSMSRSRGSVECMVLATATEDGVCFRIVEFYNDPTGESATFEAYIKNGLIFGRNDYELAGYVLRFAEDTGVPTLYYVSQNMDELPAEEESIQ